MNIWYFRQVGDVPPDRAAYYFALVDPEFNPRPVYHAVRQIPAQGDGQSAGERALEGAGWLFPVLGAIFCLMSLAGLVLGWRIRKG